MLGAMVLMGCLGTPTDARAQAPISEGDVQVDFSRRLGPIPPVLKPGFWVAVDDKTDLYKEKIEMVRDDLRLGAVGIGVERVLLASTSLPDLRRRLTEDAELGSWVETARAEGGRVVVQIVKMPRWLAANPSDRPQEMSEFPQYSISPPRSYALWEQAVEAVVSHFRHQLGVSAAYVVWNEPDIYSWDGTAAEYLQLYRHTALAIKRVDPKALVGGPAVSELHGPAKPATKSIEQGPFLKNFLKYGRAQGLPLDFVVWHEYDTLPSSYRWRAEVVRSWLREAGYPEATPLWVLDWNGWQQFDLNNPRYRFGSPERDTEVNAAYAAATVTNMSEAGIALQTFGSLEELDQGMFKVPDQFVGGFGALTRNYIVKPVYNAFRMLSRLKGELVAVETADPFLSVIGATSADSHTILLSNFIPTAAMLQREAEHIAAAAGMSAEFGQRHGLTLELVLGVAAGHVSENDPRIPQAARSRMSAFRNAIAPHIQVSELAQHRRADRVPVTVRWEGSGGGPWRVERYAIDGLHSNSFAHRETVEGWLHGPHEGLKREVFRRLREEGASEGQLLELSRLSAQGVPPDEVPEALRQLGWRALQLTREVFVEQLRAFNRAPGIGLDLVEERVLTQGEDGLRFDMEPDSVVLLVVTR